MTICKGVFKIVIGLVIAATMIVLFCFITLPALNQDRTLMVEQEMDAHNKTLEEIKQDFSYVLSAENVSIEMGKNINIMISGETCDLEVELNRELKVLTLKTIDKTEDASVGLGFACCGEVIAVIIAIILFWSAIGDISDGISIARARKIERKRAKKESVDVEVLV